MRRLMGLCKHVRESVCVSQPISVSGWYTVTDAESLGYPVAQDPERRLLPFIQCIFVNWGATVQNHAGQKEVTELKPQAASSYLKCLRLGMFQICEFWRLWNNYIFLIHTALLSPKPEIHIVLKTDTFQVTHWHSENLRCLIKLGMLKLGI